MINITQQLMTVHIKRRISGNQQEKDIGSESKCSLCTVAVGVRGEDEVYCGLSCVVHGGPHGRTWGVCFGTAFKRSLSRRQFDSWTHQEERRIR
ncbi:hypothetical protein INR49_016132 [Caranx melampygus]|nr:hypothetical protein INR49_016132 [Caranx melampygus]